MRQRRVALLKDYDVWYRAQAQRRRRTRRVESPPRTDITESELKNFIRKSLPLEGQRLVGLFDAFSMRGSPRVLLHFEVGVVDVQHCNNNIQQTTRFCTHPEIPNTLKQIQVSNVEKNVLGLELLKNPMLAHDALRGRVAEKKTTPPHPTPKPVRWRASQGVVLNCKACLNPKTSRPQDHAFDRGCAASDGPYITALRNPKTPAKIGVPPGSPEARLRAGSASAKKLRASIPPPMVGTILRNVSAMFLL